jgi:hypothetical protein
MKTRELPFYHGVSLGFTLPAILVVTGGMFILAIGVLLVSIIERRSARATADFQRAGLAASAGLEEVRGMFNREAANDDFMILQSFRANQIATGREPAPQLFLARGKVAGSGYVYRYIPLFSTSCQPLETSRLASPEVEPLVGGQPHEQIEFFTMPYQDKVRAAWRLIYDERGWVVARYAYYVEDLQGRLDPRCVGNVDGPASTHVRAVYPFPAPGLDPCPGSDFHAPLDQVALFAIESTTCSNNQGSLGKTLVENRRLLVSPGSTLAAAGIDPPLVRDPTGRLMDLRARAAEENLCANLRPYFERPMIPYVPGIHPNVAGSPRINLNALLEKSPDLAVNEMAAFIRSALPDFDHRAGGFPDDYVKTLAANAIDYADSDSNATVMPNAYRGLDAYPLMSEIALQVNYIGIANQNDRKIMRFRFKLFAELLNPTSQPVSGEARLSYEVSLPMDGIGTAVGGESFDSPSMLSDPKVSTHDLTRMGGRYWSPSIHVSLEPNQYLCYLFADVEYRIDVGASSDSILDATPFSLNETKGASGVSLMWGNQVVERAESILRQAGLIYSSKNGVITGGFNVGTPETLTKAALPGYVYDDYPSMYYNMGDPRITHYLRSAQLDENAYPENSSPNRRNIRLDIYQNDISTKPKVYARVLPSEWPDGGHNSAVGTWSPGTRDTVEMTDPKFNFAYDPEMRMSAPQVISNRGRFFSVTELGRVFDPLMHEPAFPDPEETETFLSKGKMPASHTRWPDVDYPCSSRFYGGGNSLRIGRPEHPAFQPSRAPGLLATHLLDLFHAGLSRSDDPAERSGPLIRIEGQVNLNTATRDSLRAMAAGDLTMDPLLARRTSDDHDGTQMPPTLPLSLSAPTSFQEADRIADAVIRGRPYHSTAALAFARDSNGDEVFGNPAAYSENTQIEWSDAAAEEVFARMYEGSTVRSRNFRVWIVAQALGVSAAPGGVPVVIAEVRKAHTLFVDPGERAADGSMLHETLQTTITFSNDF